VGTEAQSARAEARSTRAESSSGEGGRYCRRLTPRAMTRTDKKIAETDSVPISSLARCDSGMQSVGLKAEELVIEM
jgi:hypothetical protein